MKKLGKLLLFAAMAALLTCLLCVALNAETVSGTCGAEGDGSNLTWTLDTETGVLKIEGKGAMADYKYVAPWYGYYSSVKSVNVGDEVTRIGHKAFHDCSLTSIAIPDSVTSIGDSAFRDCSSLTSITIPSSVIIIGSRAFDGCSKLKYNEYDNAKYLGNAENPYHALILAKYTYITDCTINDSTKVIGGGAFEYCNWLTGITFGENSQLTSIGDSAFFDCISLTSIEIPSSVTSIGNSAFEYCISLTSIEIPNSVTSIGNSAFNGCSSLTSITIYSKTVKIYDRLDTISETAIIYGYKGSTAEAYAKKYNRTFIPLECDEHNFGDTYKHDDINHWLECVDCGKKKDEVAHIFDNSCDTTCDTCGYVRNITHSYEQKHDDSSHWNECSVCHDKKDITSHIFDNACDTTCDICGYTRSITHNYEQKHDETNHWLECSVCHEKKDGAAHTFRQRFDKTHHWNECSCGFIKDKSEHTLDEEGKCTECRFGRVMLGDLNGDGKISAIDLTLMRKYIAGYKVDMIEAAADLNGDGRITAVDLTMLRKYIAGLITEF